MPFTTLPSEILLHITSYLPPSSIPTFAHLNSLTYRTTHHILLPILTRQHRRAKMIYRFGQPDRELGICMSDPSNSISGIPTLDKKYAAPEAGALPNFEYLRLNGDLYWLLPLPEDVHEESLTWYQGTTCPESDLASIIQSAERVGVEIPRALIKLMSSQTMIESFYLGGDFFCLGPTLVKCLPEDDQNGGGYMIKFVSDQQACGFWALYLAPGGYSCVLGSQDDVHCWRCSSRDDDYAHGQPPSSEDHPQPEMADGIPISCERVNPVLAHPDFEEWLCMRYFDGWLSATIEDEDRVLDVRQQDYIDNFWPKKPGFKG